MNVARTIKNRINEFQETEPIFIDEMAKGFMDQKNVVYVAINRLVYDGTIENYAKGIYYKPKKTRFGKVGIDKRQLLQKKYLIRNDETIGYITGPEIWNNWGLTTQMPNRTWIAQNIRQKKIDEKHNVVLIKAKGDIKKTNVKAFQYLDVIEQIDQIQDAKKEEIIEKLIKIFVDKFDVHDKIAVIEEVKKYQKRVKVLFGLIAERTNIRDEYYLEFLRYLKEDVQKGKKVIIDVNPRVFDNNRTWGNGYATTFE
jgi:hypothetical protein